MEVRGLTHKRAIEFGTGYETTHFDSLRLSFSFTSGLLVQAQESHKVLGCPKFEQIIQFNKKNLDKMDNFSKQKKKKSEENLSKFCPIFF